MVFGNADGIVLCLQGKLDLDVVLLGAEDDADGRLVVGSAFIFVQEVEVEVHLAGMLGLKAGDFEVEGDQGFEEAVVEEQIDVVVLLAKDQAVLASDETKTVTEFQDESLKVRDEAVFEFAFLHLAVDSEEFEIVTALEYLIGLFGEILGQSQCEIMGLLLDHRPLVGTSLDLVEQDAAGPAEPGGGTKVVETCCGVFHLLQ